MINKKEVQHITKLARLGLSQKEIEKFKKELSKILDYIDKLKEVDVSEVKITSHSILVENTMRDDKGRKKEGFQKSKLLELAPETKDGYLKVKPIL